MENEIISESINVQEINQSPDKFFIIDLMNKEDFATRHIPGSVNIPLAELESRIAEIPKDKTVVLACNRGLMKSEMGLQQLKKSGITTAKKLDGGIFGWFDSKSSAPAC
jgi:rhodanese-related sulfurtransferase